MMSIIAIIMAIGAPGLLAARRQFIVDSDAQELVSAVRSAQNNAISFKNGSGTSTKAWGVKIDVANNDFSILSVDIQPLTALTRTEGTDLKKYPVVKLAAGPDSTVFVYFTSPFGRAFVCSKEKTAWVMSSRPEQDFVPSDTLDCNVTKNITLNYNGADPSQVITINANGDIYAK